MFKKLILSYFFKEQLSAFEVFEVFEGFVMVTIVIGFLAINKSCFLILAVLAVAGMLVLTRIIQEIGLSYLEECDDKDAEDKQ